MGFSQQYQQDNQMDCNLSRCRIRRLNHMRHRWIRDSYFPKFRKEQLGWFLCLLQQHSCYRLTDCWQFHLFPIKRHLVMSNVRLQDHIQMQLDRNLLNWLKSHLVQHHKWMIRFLFLHLKEEIHKSHMDFKTILLESYLHRM